MRYTEALQERHPVAAWFSEPYVQVYGQGIAYAVTDRRALIVIRPPGSRRFCWVRTLRPEELRQRHLRPWGGADDLDLVFPDAVPPPRTPFQAWLRLRPQDLDIPFTDRRFASPGPFGPDPRPVGFFGIVGAWHVDDLIGRTFG